MIFYCKKSSEFSGFRGFFFALIKIVFERSGCQRFRFFPHLLLVCLIIRYCEFKNRVFLMKLFPHFCGIRNSTGSFLFSVFIAFCSIPDLLMDLRYVDEIGFV